MATKKTKRRAPASRAKKSGGSAFPAMSELLKAIEDNFRALATMVPTGTAAKPKRKAAKRKAAKRRTPATRAKAAAKRVAATAKRAMPRAKKRTRRADKRPSASAPI